MPDRRRGDAHVHLAGAGVAQHLHDLARRVAAHDRVVDDDEALARDDLGQRVELQPQAVLAQLLAGLDEGARDVAVLDEAVVLREAGRAREAARGGVARVRAPGSRGRPRPAPPPQDLAHPPARDLEHLAAQPRVRAREVDVLEHAERAPLASRARRRVQGSPAIPKASLAEQRQVVDAFLTALRTGDFEGLVAVLDPDVVVKLDEAAGRPGTPREIHGARNWAKGAVAFSRNLEGAVEPMLVNGEVGLVWAPQGRVFRVLRLSIHDGKIATVDIVADPSRLAEFEITVLDK